MRRLILIGIIFLLLLLAVCPCLGIPVTNAPTMIGNNNVTFNAAGMTSPNWFEYGMTSGYLLWKTPNQTSTGDVSKYTYGSPLMAGQVFYYRACDSTGCGAEQMFLMLGATPQPQTTFGYVYQNITESGFEPEILMSNALQPYFWVAPQSVVWGLLFLFIYAGMWIRGRDVTIPVIMGLITGFMILNPTYGMGLPAEFIGLSQGLAYASIAGIVFVLFKR